MIIEVNNCRKNSGKISWYFFGVHKFVL